MSNNNYKMLVRNMRRMNELGFEDTKSLIDAYEEMKNFLIMLSDMVEGGDEDYACREILGWKKEASGDE